VACGRTDGRTARQADRMKLTVDLRKFASGCNKINQRPEGRCRFTGKYNIKLDSQI